MTTILDTRAVPPSDRTGYWSAGIMRHFFPIQVEAVNSPFFEARLAGGEVGPIGVRSIKGLPHRVTRTRPMIAAGDPECILLYLVSSGSVRIEQADRGCVLQPGDIAFQDTSRPSMFEGQDAFEVTVFSLPRQFIGARAESFVRRTATKVGDGDGRLARLASPFLMGLATAAAHGTGLSQREGESAAQMLLPMLRNLYREEASDISQSDALLARMRGYALGHLHDPRLGPERIARTHFVSTRYVHKLFAASGTGVSAWIRERRLEGAAEELSESPGTPIADVATRWGYRNPTSFSRAFRELHGCAPREIRRASSPAKEPSLPI